MHLYNYQFLKPGTLHYVTLGSLFFEMKSLWHHATFTCSLLIIIICSAD